MTSLDLVPVRRALISVSDKEGLVELGRALAARGVEILSTGGSAKALADAGVAVKEVSDHTGFPEMLDGRVKTLHPVIHGGLLGRRDLAAHRDAMQAHGIAPIDLLVVNLYPFEATVAAGRGFEDCIENIDIGGPALIRGAAKNHDAVAVVTDTADYAALTAELSANDGATSLALRRRLAAAAYARTAAYDAAISGWFAGQVGEIFPRRIAIAGELRQTLRYGENPHQTAAFYTAPRLTAQPVRGLATAEQLQGKELSYNNLNDTDAAF
ncbi:MAG: bifunctional phosphoribosylaminoimidazolecarboxamide formyltransferase/IMP cyclohydrolase, partial [Alphaproteobacteria bacterium]